MDTNQGQITVVGQETQPLAVKSESAYMELVKERKYLLHSIEYDFPIENPNEFGSTPWLVYERDAIRKRIYDIDKELGVMFKNRVEKPVRKFAVKWYLAKKWTIYAADNAVIATSIPYDRLVEAANTDFRTGSWEVRWSDNLISELKAVGV